MLPIQQKIFFHVLMAAIEIPESVFGLMITVHSIHLKPINRLNAACFLLALIVNQQLGSLRTMTRP